MRTTLTILLLALCSCASQQRSTITLSDKEAVGAAQAAVLASLKDPDSARFGPLVRKKVQGSFTLTMFGGNADHNDVVCGTVNAKNSYGGYTGPKIFAYQTDYGKLYLDDDRSYLGSMWCGQ